MAVSLMNIDNKYQEAKLKKGMDPDTFIMTLEDLRDHMREMKAPISDEKFFRDILNKVGKDYLSVMEQVENTIQEDGSYGVSLEGLRDRLINKYERIKEDGGGDDSDGEEHALYMGGGKFVRQFKGRCH